MPTLKALIRNDTQVSHLSVHDLNLTRTLFVTRSRRSIIDSDDGRHPGAQGPGWLAESGR